MDTNPTTPLPDYSGDVFMVLDLETTGLTIEGGSIIEVAWAVRPSLIKLAALRPEDVRTTFILAVPDKPTLFEPMAAQMHAETGLLKEYIAGDTGYPVHIVAHMISLGIREQTTGGRAVLVGNSVHFDHQWLDAKMPELTPYLHYRHVDLTSDWMVGEEAGIEKLDRSVGTKHRAKDDVLTTLLQLRDALDIREHAAIYREQSGWKPVL